jgi:hypothetical protein
LPKRLTGRNSGPLSMRDRSVQSRTARTGHVRGRPPYGKRDAHSREHVGAGRVRLGGNDDDPVRGQHLERTAHADRQRRFPLVLDVGGPFQHPPPAQLEARVRRMIVNRSNELEDHAGIATIARQGDRRLLDGMPGAQLLVSPRPAP